MKRGKMCDTVPYLSLSPIFLLIVGYFILGEVPDLQGVAGVIVIAVGGFWLSRAGAAADAVERSSSGGAPVKQKSLFAGLPPGSGIYIFVATIQSISSAYDKVG